MEKVFIAAEVPFPTRGSSPNRLEAGAVTTWCFPSDELWPSDSTNQHISKYPGGFAGSQQDKPSPVTVNYFKKSPNAESVSDRMFPVKLKRGWMAPTESGTLSHHLPTFLPDVLVHSTQRKEKNHRISGFALVWQVGIFPMRKAHCCALQQWLEPRRVLHGHCLVALLQRTMHTCFQHMCTFSSRLKVMLPDLLHKYERCSLIFYVATPRERQVKGWGSDLWGRYALIFILHKWRIMKGHIRTVLNIWCMTRSGSKCLLIMRVVLKLTSTELGNRAVIMARYGASIAALEYSRILQKNTSWNEIHLGAHC